MKRANGASLASGNSLEEQRQSLEHKDQEDSAAETIHGKNVASDPGCEVAWINNCKPLDSKADEIQPETMSDFLDEE